MDILFNLQVDCEATQASINDAALGERAVRGLGELLAQTGMKASFLVIPKDLRAHAALYRDLERQGHEIGLHTHPADQGYEEFLGVYSFEEQTRIVREGMEVFAEAMGRPPLAFTPGYGSANDHTYPALEALGLKHGLVAIPTRNLPQCACVWGSVSLEPRYPHRWNRCLNGDVDFVDVPPTVDIESRMWGGAHPQDLRVELVDAKNHWYTIHKNVKRLMAAGDKAPVKHLKAVTHNTFDFSDPRNFRRETLLGIISAARSICETEGARLVPATTADIAAAYRAAVPRPAGGVKLTLDARGRSAAKGS
jgi:hypothetical protein